PSCRNSISKHRSGGWSDPTAAVFFRTRYCGQHTCAGVSRHQRLHRPSTAPRTAFSFSLPQPPRPPFSQLIRERPSLPRSHPASSSPTSVPFLEQPICEVQEEHRVQPNGGVRMKIRFVSMWSTLAALLVLPGALRAEERKIVIKEVSK